ncbi:MAG: alpha-L-rhamnosidase C-terminal domain-containing protein [Phycisphaeraceae bacterium]
MMRVVLDAWPFDTRRMDKPVQDWGAWPCRWVHCTDAGATPFVTAYRLRVMLPAAATVRVHVSADERYELYVDGGRIGRGPERGDADHWQFETYDLPLSAGAHVVVARVWSLGVGRPFAQMTVRPGFVLCPQDAALLPQWATGVAAWEARRLGGYAFVKPGSAWGSGDNVVIDGAAYPWGVERGDGDGWALVTPGLEAIDQRYTTGFGECGEERHRLAPALLPAMLDEPRGHAAVRAVEALDAQVGPAPVGALPGVSRARHLPDEAGAWEAMIRTGKPLTIPPRTVRRVILDLEQYYCAYHRLVTTGGAGARVDVHWSEGLWEKPDKAIKGDRNAIQGKYFVGVGDTFLPDGGPQRVFEPLWWQAGRYVQLLVRTAEEPLSIEGFSYSETRYPLEDQSRFACSDERLAEAWPIMFRTLQMCAHETYFDCPYYEQLMYVGDTRLEVLTTYCTTSDDRLPRKALQAFDWSRLGSGLTQSRYPSKVTQVIPPFSLWWCAMVYDFALWRGDRELVAMLMPGVRGAIDAYSRFINDQGLIEAPQGWNFMDWVPGWSTGYPPDGAWGVSALINWQLVLVLTQVAQVEAWLGETELAQRDHRLARALAVRAGAAFWDERRGLFADDLSKKHFSEHTQCLALLSGLVDEGRRPRMVEGLLNAKDLARQTIYFSHYLFETLRQEKRMGVVLRRFEEWYDLKAMGLMTAREKPEPSRSDCHAWGAHPIYHSFASVLGIRPGSFGFATVRIEPQLGTLARVSGTMPHPRGQIEATFEVAGAGLRGSVTLPQGVTGTLVVGGSELPLHSGRNEVSELATSPVAEARA